MENRAGFAAKFARARDLMFEHWADELADAGRKAIDKPELTNALRLDSDNRKWLLARLKPSLYGDRLDARLANPDGTPLQVDASQAIKALIDALPMLVPAALPAPVPLDVEAVPVEEGER
jgi:hypothetical protein